MTSPTSGRRPPSLRWFCRFTGRALMWVSGVVALVGIVGMWIAPAFVERNGVAFIVSFPVFLYGVFLRVAGRPRPSYVPPLSRKQRITLWIGALITIVAPLSVVLAMQGVIHGGVGIVGFAFIWLGPMIVSATIREPARHDDRPESGGAVMRM